MLVFSFLLLTSKHRSASHHSQLRVTSLRVLVSLWVTFYFIMCDECFAVSELNWKNYFHLTKKNNSRPFYIQSCNLHNLLLKWYFKTLLQILERQTHRLVMETSSVPLTYRLAAALVPPSSSLLRCPWARPLTPDRSSGAAWWPADQIVVVPGGFQVWTSATVWMIEREGLLSTITGTKVQSLAVTFINRAYQVLHLHAHMYSACLV